MHSLAPLPYSFAALEPHIDSKTMEIHYSKHHQTYVDKLNTALNDLLELKDEPIIELLSNLNRVPDNVRNAVRNNGGGHWNHTFFWNIMTPGGNNDISSELRSAIDKCCGSFETFKEHFTAAGLNRFGSGWVWLIKKENDEVEIVSTPNQDNPLMSVAEVKGTPVLGLDVWEHAYYLKHQNKRADYINDWWNVVNWQKVSELFAA